ncbi:MAG: type VI secretion system ImpA family N-terminal domain-containing protein, partial [Planctomycetes bacterium]|nr:type VI secretion system ImpA family N-terminal domain-containing protein [Planctomycetota bacterium]
MSISAASETSPRAAAAAGLDKLRWAASLLEKEYGQDEPRERLQTLISVLEGIVEILPGELAAEGAGDAPSAPAELAAEFLPLEDLFRPISAESPSGDNIRLSGELNDLRSLTVNRARASDFQPRWGQSASRAIEILRSRAKDLAVVTQLLESLIMSDQVAALGEGFVVVRGLLERFWDDLYPEAEDGDCEMRAEELARMQEVLTAALHRKLRPVH